MHSQVTRWTEAEDLSPWDGKAQAEITTNITLGEAR